MKKRIDLGSKVERFAHSGRGGGSVFTKREVQKIRCRRRPVVGCVFRDLLRVLPRWVRQGGVFLLFLVGGLLFDRCQIEDFERERSLNYDATWAVPVGRASVGAEEVLAEYGGRDFRVAQDTNRLLFTYFLWQDNMVLHERTSSVRVERLEEIVEQEEDVPAPVSPPQRATRREHLELGLEFGSEVERVDSIVYRRGAIYVTQSSSYPTRLESDIIFSDLRAGGTRMPLRASFLADYRGTLPISETKRYTLDNYHLNGVGGEGFLPAVLELRTEQRVGEALERGDAVRYEIEVRNTEVGRFYGRLSTQDVSLGRQELPINGLEHITGEEEVVFTNPRLLLFFDNQYGIPLEVTLRNMSLMRGGSSMSALEGEALEDSFFVPGAEVPGETRRTERVLDISNTNIDDLFLENHMGLFFDIEAVVNPPVPYPQVAQNFSADNFSLNISIMLEVPYSVIVRERVTMHGFSNTYRDELEVQEVSVDYSALKAFTLRLIIENSLPLEGLAAVMLGDRGEEMEMLENDIEVGMPEMSNDRVMGMRKYTYDIRVRGNAYDRFMGADSLFVSTTMSSERDASGDYKVSRLYSDHELGIQVVAIADIEERF